MLPATTQEVELPSSTTLTLGPSNVILGSNTITIAPLSGGAAVPAGATLSSGSFTIVAKPGPGWGEDGSVIGQDLLSGLKALQTQASGVVDTLNSINSVGQSWAAGKASDGDLASSLNDLIPKAYDALTTLEGDMSSLSEAYELSELDSTGRTVYFEAYAGSRGASNLLPPLRGLIPISTFTITQFRLFFKHYWPQVLLIKVTTLVAFIGFSFTKTQTGTDPKLPEEWYLEVIEGTTLKTFQEWIKTLPDRGSGAQLVYDNIPLSHGYVTIMKKEEAAVVALDPLCFVIVSNRPVGPDVLGGTNNTTPGEPGVVPKDLERRAITYNVQRRINSPNHLKLISQQPFSLERPVPPLLDYLYDPSLGAGSTVIVIDTGLNKANPVRWSYQVK
jgi:hypothetical protein